MFNTCTCLIIASLENCLHNSQPYLCFNNLEWTAISFLGLCQLVLEIIKPFSKHFMGKIIYLMELFHPRFHYAANQVPLVIYQIMIFLVLYLIPSVVPSPTVFIKELEPNNNKIKILKKWLEM